jgi:hypothetical protein
VRRENFHAQRTTGHDKAAFQGRAEDAGEGREEGKIFEKFKADANKTKERS